MGANINMTAGMSGKCAISMCLAMLERVPRTDAGYLYCVAMSELIKEDIDLDRPNGVWWQDGMGWTDLHSPLYDAL
jgi:hypothetical protein